MLKSFVNNEYFIHYFLIIVFSYVMELLKEY